MTAKPIAEAERLAIIETQLKRVVSDMESEKRTRSDANTVINNHLLRQDDKIDGLAGTMHRGLGVMIALQFLIPIAAAIALAIWKK